MSMLRKSNFPVWLPDVISWVGVAVYFVQSVWLAHTTISNLDEASYLLKGYLFATGQYYPFEPGMPTGKSPLAFLIPGYVQLWFGPGVRTGRYLAVFFGLMAVVGLWVISRRVGSRWLAAGAVWTLALSPVVIKYYSGGATQSVIAFLMAWMLVLCLGKDRSFWELSIAGFLASIMMMVRQNMMPVLPLLILYTFWQYGWKRSWGAAMFGIGVIAFLFYIYWPGILQLWTWVPLINLPSSAVYSGGGTSVWLPEITLSGRVISVFQSFRFHFVALTGVMFAIFLFPKKKLLQLQTHSKMLAFLVLLFLGLLYMHFEAAIRLDYCVFCFSAYIAFFNVAGIVLVAATFFLWQEQTQRPMQILLVGVSLILAAGMGFSAFENLRDFLLYLPAPRIRDFSILPGFVTWRDLLFNGLGWDQNLSAKVLSAVFGFLVGVFLLILIYLIWRKWFATLDFGRFFANAALLTGLIFSPFLHGSVQDCDSDVIAANEQIGSHLRGIIPPGSLVYWDGGRSAVSFLYLPGVKMFPPQINGGYTFFRGGETSEVIKFGYWNEKLDEQWKSSADFFIIESVRYQRKDWDQFFTPDRFDEYPRTSVGTSCTTESQLRIFRRK